MPDRDPQRAYEESLNRAVALYKEPYDDRDGERANSLPSLRAVAEEMGTSIIRARKLLITAGMYTSVTSRWVQELGKGACSPALFSVCLWSLKL